MSFTCLQEDGDEINAKQCKKRRALLFNSATPAQVYMHVKSTVWISLPVCNVKALMLNNSRGTGLAAFADGHLNRQTLKLMQAIHLKQ